MDVSKIESFLRNDLIKLLNEIVAAFRAEFFSLRGVLEIILIPLSFFAGRFIGSRLRPRIESGLGRRLPALVTQSLLFQTVLDQIWLLFTLFFIRLAIFLMSAQEVRPHLLVIFSSLIMAWVVIKIVSSLVMNKFWARFISMTAWIMAALNVFGVLGRTIDFLDTVGFTYNNKNLSIILLFKGIILLVALVQVALFANRLTQDRIEKSTSMSPSLRVLASKGVKVGFVTFAVYLGLKGIGVDFTGLAVFSGAVGVGVGFGLQKVISNLVCGVILLLERSIKPGDTIEVETVYGVIKSLNARFVSVVTRDGKEYLIPNDMLITGTVVNWTHSDPEVRVRIPFGVSYSSDLRKAMELSEQCAKSIKGVLSNPRPICRMTAYGASSVDFELRIWINDPEKGVGRVKSDVMLAIWDAFKENGIEFPFPQQDVFIKNLPEKAGR